MKSSEAGRAGQQEPGRGQCEAGGGRPRGRDRQCPHMGSRRSAPPPLVLGPLRRRAAPPLTPFARIRPAVGAARPAHPARRGGGGMRKDAEPECGPQGQNHIDPGLSDCWTACCLLRSRETSMQREVGKSCQKGQQSCSGQRQGAHRQQSISTPGLEAEFQLESYPCKGCACLQPHQLSRLKVEEGMYVARPENTGIEWG